MDIVVWVPIATFCKADRIAQVAMEAERLSYLPGVLPACRIRAVLPRFQTLRFAQ